eukprot:TRINITY_DN1920_c0_g1_i1.p1 TRINITY_DN1920_c0_g1~~TRINITY_DN1920_c0_g1_i1.p1  ORF type:complete len:188 (-),score=21.93 TRINITY_DN1920_c0_g1_i1:75-638(-)
MATSAPVVGQNNPSDVDKTTDSNLRYMAYMARIRNIAIVLKGAARYMAYVSDVGEAFRPIVHPRVVTAAYAMSWSYVIGDVAYEGYKEHKEGGTAMEVTRTVISRGIFQSVASMALPAFTIHSVVNVSRKAFDKVGKFQKWGPSAMGIGIIPALPFMFDHPVEWVVEKTFDTLWPVENKKHKHHKEE